MNYKRGYEIERKVMRLLAAAGYITARTAGSHSPFDVVAVNSTGVRLIQVKRTKRDKFDALLDMAIEEIQQVPRLPGVSREVWIWVDGRGWVVKVTV